VVEERKNEIILLVPDPIQRGQVRSLLERDGYLVAEARDPVQLKDLLKASRALALVIQPHAPNVAVERLEAEIPRAHPDIDVIVPTGFGHALVEGGLGRSRVAHFALDALYLLANLVEKTAGKPLVAERAAQMAELTALRLGLSRLHVETVAAAAVLACAGSALAKFRFGQDGANKSDGGVSPELGAALAAAATLRSPSDLAAVLGAVDERWDGRGRPHGLKGTMIPIEARIVAVARDYLHATTTQDPSKALPSITSRASSDYDPAVVNAFCRALRDTEYVSRLQSNKGELRVVVADGDPSALAVAELRLSAAGFAVKSFVDGRAAQDAILADPPDAVVSEIVLPRFDGISLLLKLRREAKTAAVPVFLYGTANAPTVTKALKLGANDVMAKPVNFDVLAVKIRESTKKVAAAREEAATQVKAGQSGVFGTLEEVSITDLLQVISFGRKTATIYIEGKKGEGRVCLERGEPYAAFTKTLSGLPAFCEIAGWKTGRFKMETGELAMEKNLHGNLEALLLEALRRQDETSAPGDALSNSLLGEG
jgi:response regulator RpfG family c-di-GMP phosphodiesterase